MENTLVFKRDSKKMRQYVGSRVQVGTKVDSDPFTYRGLNKDSNPVFNGSELPGNWRIGNPFTSLGVVSISHVAYVFK